MRGLGVWCSPTTSIRLSGALDSGRARQEGAIEFRQREREREMARGGWRGQSSVKGAPHGQARLDTTQQAPGGGGGDRRPRPGPQAPQRLTDFPAAERGSGSELRRPVGGAEARHRGPRAWGCCHFTAHRSHHRRRIHKMQTKKNNLLMLINPPITRPGGPW